MDSEQNPYRSPENTDAPPENHPPDEPKPDPHGCVIALGFLIGGVVFTPLAHFGLCLLTFLTSRDPSDPDFDPETDGAIPYGLVCFLPFLFLIGGWIGAVVARWLTSRK